MNLTFNTSTSFNNTSTTVEVFEIEPAGFISQNNTYYTYIFLSTTIHFNKSKDSQHTEQARMAAGICVYVNRKMLKC